MVLHAAMLNIYMVLHTYVHIRCIYTDTRDALNFVTQSFLHLYICCALFKNFYNNECAERGRH